MVLHLPILLKKRGTNSTEVLSLPALRFLAALAPVAGLFALTGWCQKEQRGEVPTVARRHERRVCDTG